ncbi:putative permease YjgP/YjgQ family protein [Thalassoglobus neptunius]|uniref:Putative permease YjgP/YjgQ family protein n=1 Tax=Thalassoglobus neptunius TaxID=1938619 RepID=A0A5C5X581_9PLAN|nr:LptF/LptG family permease [Thalassoglobus neptunius]TWT58084.1 putative permease YjgP/YjgQ family protein [Thalassoglobus neptunius]
MTTYDRYLLFRYFHIIAVFLIASIGLFAVIDGFTNLDSFQESVEEANGNSMMLLNLMAHHYFYHSLMVIDLAGPSIVVISAVSTLALLLKSGEIHPVLAAGIPTYRLTLPLAFGVLAISGALLANQELVLPAIAPKLQRKHGQSAEDAQNVDPQFDLRWQMFLTGEGVYPEEKRLHKPQFRIQPPLLTTDYFTLEAEDGIYLPPQSDEDGTQRPGGWLLKQTSVPFQEFPLTELGRQNIVPQPNGTDVFINTHLSFSQMSRKTSNYRLMGTPQLLRFLHEPYGSDISRRGILMHLHSRITQPLLTLVGLYIVIPLIVRKDRMSTMQQVTNIATCVIVLAIIYGVSIGSSFLGQSGIVPAEQAAWVPIVLGGSLAGWLTGSVRT